MSTVKKALSEVASVFLKVAERDIGQEDTLQSMQHQPTERKNSQTPPKALSE